MKKSHIICKQSDTNVFDFDLVYMRENGKWSDSIESAKKYSEQETQNLQLLYDDLDRIAVPGEYYMVITILHL